ncbi:Tetratricopeptide repeat (TPR) superfamily protein [Trifolium repens]|nr:Tetratricopeptide repeat (TPR) superfamily protein [Trifolium repens]
MLDVAQNRNDTEEFIWCNFCKAQLFGVDEAKLEERPFMRGAYNMFEDGGDPEKSVLNIQLITKKSTTLNLLLTGYSSAGKQVHPGGALQDVLHLHDVLARVSLEKLCCTISRAKSLDGWCV